jgi:uncharacterized Tic20 family protein
MSEATQTTTVIEAQDRTLAILTHLSGLSGYIIPLGGVLVPIIIWVVKKDDRVISAIARQAVLLNVAVFVCGIALALLMLTVILIPVTFLGWAVLGLIAVILPVVGAVKASDGEFYIYPVVGSAP